MKDLVVRAKLMEDFSFLEARMEQVTTAKLAVSIAEAELRKVKGEGGNITAAAELLEKTQATLSFHIDQLDRLCVRFGLMPQLLERGLVFAPTQNNFFTNPANPLALSDGGFGNHEEAREGLSQIIGFARRKEVVEEFVGQYPAAESGTENKPIIFKRQ